MSDKDVKDNELESKRTEKIDKEGEHKVGEGPRSLQNWQAMAKTCHDRKTAREDGGFGRCRSSIDDRRES